MTAPRVELRPATDADRPFLAAVYASTREQELAAVPFTPEQRQAFLDHQFAAQSHHYAEHYRDASYDVIEVDGMPAGRLIVGRWPRELRIVDVALLPDFRGRGVGTRLLTPLLAEADARDVPTTIHVEQQNPAQRLYRRLGFLPMEEVGPYRRFERPPASAAAVSAPAAD